MEFFYQIKATQKSGKTDAVIWFTAKTEARAALTLDVELEEAGIETGRGKDYAKPVRTDMPVADDLPEESTVDLTWCDRYELADDQRTWNVKLKTEKSPHGEATITPAITTSEATLTSTTEVSVDTADAGNTVLVENRTPGVRFAIHLLSDKYQTHISKDLHMAACSMSLDEENAYFQNLILAKNYVTGIDDLSLHAEWNMVQALKTLFPHGEEHKASQLTGFMSAWIMAEDRKQLVEDWRAGNLPAKPEEPEFRYEHGLRIHKNNDEATGYSVCKMSFRKQLLSQLTVDELRHHITRSEHAELHALEMDTDNHYVQNLLLAAGNCEDVKSYDTKDLWRYTKAIREVFNMEKRHELSLILQFTKTWAATPYIDRGILTREWAAGNRINTVQRTDAGTNADGGHITDRGADVHHTLDTLDQEIACALLPMDFNYREIPGSIHRRGKEIVTKKEEPWKSWSKILRNQPGVLAVNRTAIFNLVRVAPDSIHLNPVAHLEFVNRTMTAEFNAAVDLLPFTEATSAPVIDATTENEKAPRKSFCTHEENLQRVREEGARQRAEEAANAEQQHALPKWADGGEQQPADEGEAETQTLQKWARTADSKPSVANHGGGIFSIEGLMSEKQPESDDRSSVNEETTSDVQMETTNAQKGETVDEIPPGEGADAADQKTAALNPSEVLAPAAPELGNQNQADVNQNADSVSQNCAPVNQNEPEPVQSDPVVKQDEPAVFTHLMVDLETMGEKPGAPIVSIGAVFFHPDSGSTGAEFYQVINLESSMSFGARPDASTILWWLKQSPEARSAIVVDDSVGLVEALEQLLDFIAENAATGSNNVQLWGNGSSFDCSILEAAFELADTPFPIPHWNYRDVRTVVELGKAVGLNARYDIPFEGDQHNALADARHQVKYVSAIWQRLTAI